MTGTAPADAIENHAMRANVILLTGLILHELAYPLSEADAPGPVLFYLFYAGLFIFGTWALNRSVPLRMAAVVFGIAVFVAGVFNAASPGPVAELAVLLTSIGHHVVLAIALALYTFRARTVMSDVVLAAASLYLVVGSGFGAIFALIEWLVPGSFAVASGAAVTWQQMVYYSYVTLTTVGYGDVTPISHYAQSVAVFEAILGVLYTVILLSRIVGLSASQPPGPDAK